MRMLWAAARRPGLRPGRGGAVKVPEGGPRVEADRGVTAMTPLCPARSPRRRPGDPRRMRGQAMVEFALGATLFLLVVLAVMQFAILYHMRLVLGHASREGAR